MSGSPSNSFDKADVFHLFDARSSAAASASPAEAEEGNVFINKAQYAALVHMMAANLKLSQDTAEQLFPFAPASAQEPPLCAHLAREGVAAYWADSSANSIPDVRCCDARDVDKQEPFPATGHGPHVHCLYCFHTAVEEALPPGRGVPPPVVADFRDALSLQAHYRAHHDRYTTYLRLLDDTRNGDGSVAVDLLSDQGIAACEAAAAQEGRHGCYMAAMGTSACPIVVFYCAECDAFAPLVRFTRTSSLEGEEEHARELVDSADAAWVSTEELNVVLSRLLLSCHLLYMMDRDRFSGAAKSPSREGASGSCGASLLARPRHVIFMFKPILFHDSVDEKIIEAYEEGAECTHAAVVLPNASVVGTPAELLLLSAEAAQQALAENTGAPASSSLGTTYAPVVVGFAMEWPNEEVMTSKIAFLLSHQVAEHVEAEYVLPYKVTTRWVYIEDTEEWVQARVLFHRTVAARAELPSSYEDFADEGIRVEEHYQIDTPMPADTAKMGDGTAATCGSGHDNYEGRGIGDEKEEEEQPDDEPWAVDGCPYSMESRTIDFFARMTALAKAMHELAAWRLTIDENKESRY